MVKNTMKGLWERDDCFWNLIGSVQLHITKY